MIILNFKYEKKNRSILNCLNIKICDETKLKQYAQQFAYSESKPILIGTRAHDEPIFYRQTLQAVNYSINYQNEFFSLKILSFSTNSSCPSHFIMV